MDTLCLFINKAVKHIIVADREKAGRRESSGWDVGFCK